MQNENIPVGTCQCGCGGKTRIARQTTTALGHVRGQPVRFIIGHHQRGKRPHNAGTSRPISDRVAEVDMGYVTPCWHLGDGNRDYPLAKVDGRHVIAHRVAYEDQYGAIPEGLVLDHLCRNPRCVRPDHHEPVWQAINVRRGSGAKLTAEDVAAIRAASEPQREIARRFGVSQQHVSKIKSGRRWPSDPT